MVDPTCPTCHECQRLVITSVASQLAALVPLVERGIHPNGQNLAKGIATALAEVPESLLPLINEHALTRLRGELTGAIVDIEQGNSGPAAQRLRVAMAAWQENAFGPARSEPLSLRSSEADRGVA